RGNRHRFCPPTKARTNTSSVEPVTDSPNAEQIARLGRRRFDLLAQAGDLVVYHPLSDKRVAPPSFIQQLLPAEDPAPAAYEGRQQLEFKRSSLNNLSSPSQLPAGEVYFHLAESIDLRQLTGGSTQDGHNPCT